MCGIAGYLSKTEKLQEDALDTMLNTMILRGPDGDGRYIEDNILLGMRRLSIIDIEHGWQPFYANNGQVVAFQNGEIYNYPQLQKELIQLGHNFVSNSDTEILAHGYFAWGIEKLLEKLDGMFAIVIYDKVSQKIHFARDRFGEKPFYYFYDEQKFLYSSNTFAINKVLGDFSINQEAIYDYVLTHFISGEKTIFNGMKKLLPGHRLEFNLKDFDYKINQYYQLTSSKTQKYSVDALETALTDSLKGRLLADVPVGVFLSGGLDSSIIAVLASKISTVPLETFSMGFDDAKCDESVYSKLVAKQIGSQHHHFYFDSSSFQRLLPEVIKVMDEPIGDQAILPTFWLSHESRKHVKVVLSGEGADEIFGGYGYYNKYVGDTPNNSIVTKLVNYFTKPKPLLQPYVDYQSNELGSGFPLVASMHDLHNLFNPTLPRLDYQQYCYYPVQNSTSVQFAQSVDIQTWLANDLLVKLDRMSSGVSLEGRCPYLSRTVVELAYSLPDNLKIDKNGGGKLLLKQLGEKYFAKDFIYRKKQGFVLPMEQWIEEWMQSRNFNEYFIHLNNIGMNLNYLQTVFLDKGRVRMQFSMLVLNEWLANYKKCL
ncbi:MAG: asparagine synthase (glutamine-hydrolyzing) [Neisseriaceae bacterium]|nr:MAG: asparagine synthase (glutamine-hydrolyzing) [Neisseriaceae bacterium]